MDLIRNIIWPLYNNRRTLSLSLPVDTLATTIAAGFSATTDALCDLVRPFNTHSYTGIVAPELYSTDRDTYLLNYTLNPIGRYGGDNIPITVVAIFIEPHGDYDYKWFK